MGEREGVMPPVKSEKEISPEERKQKMLERLKDHYLSSFQAYIRAEKEGTTGVGAALGQGALGFEEAALISGLVNREEAKKMHDEALDIVKDKLSPKLKVLLGLESRDATKPL